MADKPEASDFEKFVHEARDRKKNEALAARIFGKDRRASAPFKTASLGGPLASRVGVTKRGASGTGPRNGIPTGPRSAQRQQQQPQQHAGNIDGDWTHDLHERHSAPSTPRPLSSAGGKPNAKAGAGSLASRITDPNAPAGPASRVRRDPRRTAQVARALIATELSTPNGPRGYSPATVRNTATGGGNGSSTAWNTSNSNGVNGNSSRNGPGLTIRGLAGPWVVMAQNFAPGTTAADIESAVTPVGGLVQSCRLLKTEPIVIAEIVFESKEGADNVIATFDNQTADGRLIHVYYKMSGRTPAATAAVAPTQPPREPRAIRNAPVVQDGSMGFDDPMEMEDRDHGGKGYYEDFGPRARNGNGDRNGSGGLYSDSLVPRDQQRRSNGYGSWSGGGRGSGRGGGRR